MKNFYVSGGRKRIVIRQIVAPISGTGATGDPWTWPETHWFTYDAIGGRQVEILATSQDTATEIYVEYKSGDYCRLKKAKRQ